MILLSKKLSQFGELADQVTYELDRLRNQWPLYTGGDAWLSTWSSIIVISTLLEVHPIGPNKCHTLVSQVCPEIIFWSIVYNLQEVPLWICVIIAPHYFPQAEG